LVAFAKSGQKQFTFYGQSFPEKRPIQPKNEQPK
jgi:hypothetical protein